MDKPCGMDTPVFSSVLLIEGDWVHPPSIQATHQFTLYMCFNFIHEILTFYTKFQLHGQNENLNKNLLPELSFFIFLCP